MRTKLSVLLELMDAGDWEKAIRLAAKFPSLGPHRDSILRAKDALNMPALYAQMGRDPSELILAGKAALLSRYQPASSGGSDAKVHLEETAARFPLPKMSTY